MLYWLGIDPAPAAGGLMLANAGGLDIKTLVESIQKGFEDFKSTNDQRLSKLEKGSATGDSDAKMAAIQKDLGALLSMKADLERLESKQNTAGLFGGQGAGGANPDDVAYKDAFVKQFMRKGNEGADLKALQAKAVSVGVPADGGLAVPDGMDREIDKLVRLVSPMRQLASVKPVGTSTYKKLVRRGGAGSGWVGETDDRPETSTAQLVQVEPSMGEIYAEPHVTQQALDDIWYDVEADVQEQIVEEFAVAEGAAFVTGNGTKKPKGFLAYSTAATADATRAFGTLQYIATGVAGDFAASNKGDIFFDVVASLSRKYRPGSVWTMGQTMLFEVMKIKDSTGNYLWLPSLQDSGLSLKLLGYDVVEMDEMPAKAANSLSIAFGNFKVGYTIVDRRGMTMLRDPFTRKPYVKFYTTKRVGGGVMNSEAIKLLKFATA